MSYSVSYEWWWKHHHGFSSRRHTTTSSRPGAVISGTAHTTTRVGLTTCLKCGGKRYAFPTAHAPRWRDGQLVDCSGDLVSTSSTNHEGAAHGEEAAAFHSGH